MKKLLVVLAMLLALSSNLYSQMNFPLQVGNKYVYYCLQGYTYPGGGNSYYFRSSSRILKDSIFNSHKYFLMDAYPNHTPSNIWVRFDTLSKSILAFDSANTCPFYFKEKLIDSLGMTSGTANSCSGYIFDWSRIDTIYNRIGMTKAFHLGGYSDGKLIQYNSNFGIILFESHMHMGTYGSDLYANMTGCFINGVKYGDTTLTNIHQINTNNPIEFELSQNYPNPFNPITNVKFSILNSGDVKLIVYDILGMEVQTLVNERLQPGTYEAAFDGSMLNSGVYFYKLITNGFTETKKMLLIK